MPQIPLPDIKPVKNTLHFFWLVDRSQSMSGSKIATLNQAIRESVPMVRDTARKNQALVLMRAIRFSNEADWHVGPDPVTVDQFSWPELGTQGMTATAKAIRMLAGQLTMDKMPPKRGLRPVAVLISDGFYTDTREEYDAAVTSENWGKKLIRIAIGIKTGPVADYDRDELAKFVDQETKEIFAKESRHPVLEASNPEELTHFIKWVSTEVMGATTSGKTGTGDQNAGVVFNPPSPIISSSKEPF
jgi:uncharacterized protein YegL